MKTLSLTAAQATILRWLLGSSPAQGLTVAMLGALISANAKLAAAGAKDPGGLIAFHADKPPTLGIDNVIMQSVDLDAAEAKAVTAVWGVADAGHPALRTECVIPCVTALIAEMAKE